MPDPFAVVDVCSARIDAVRRRLLELVERSWLSLDAYRDADIERWIRQVAPLLDGAQVTTANLQAAFQAAYEAAVFDTPTRLVPVAVDAVTTEALRGITTRELLHRAGVDVWRSLADGSPLEVAADRGLFRAKQLTSTGVQLAKTHTARSVMSSKGNVVGYRRVIRGASSCALCLVASTQRYRTKDLLPIHPGCDCGVQEIYGTRDPGQVIDAERLEGVNDLLAERFGSDARQSQSGFGRAGKATKFDDYRQLLVVHEHGEIGPLLGVRGQQFTGPNGLAA